MMYTPVRHYAPMMGNPPLHSSSARTVVLVARQKAEVGIQSAGPPWGNPSDRLFSRRRHAEVKWNYPVRIPESQIVRWLTGKV